MPFTLIKGSYHVRGYEPDGDSIRFSAQNDEMWDALTGRVRLNARGHAQLRLEAIDTLETHYNGQHQPIDLAVRALDFLLTELGIRAARYDPLMTTVVDAEDGTPGYILAREVEQYGRPIAFAFAGEPPQLDGANVFLSADGMAQSINYRSAQEGLAYPTYYRGLFPDLRAAFTVAVKEGRDAGRYIWAEDVTNVGFDVTGLQSVTEQHVILSKLFRRLVEYLRGGGTVAQFKEFLEANPEPITVLSSRHFTHFDNIVEVLGDRVRLTELPENIVFNP